MKCEEKNKQYTHNVTQIILRKWFLIDTKKHKKTQTHNAYSIESGKLFETWSAQKSVKHLLLLNSIVLRWSRGIWRANRFMNAMNFTRMLWMFYECLLRMWIFWKERGTADFMFLFLQIKKLRKNWNEDIIFLSINFFWKKIVSDI